jgi:type VI protein secretion system component VasK
LFDSEYEILHNSLMKRRIVRLSAPFAPVRQLRIFNFPLHFGSARRKFGAFINALFRPNPFSENPFLRGFYFTASPVGKANGNAPATVGNPYFTERFFRDVVLRDKDLVKTFIESRQRPPIFGWMLTILGGFLVFALLVMAGVSLVNNRRLLQESQTRGQDLLQMVKADAGSQPLAKKEPAVRDELNQTDYMRQHLELLDDYDRNSPPFYMRFGLYSGTKIYKENLLPLYMGVVEQRFKEPAVKKLEADLAKFASSKPVANPSKLTEDEEKLLEKHLNMLKAYLMLSGKYREQAQGSHVGNVLKDYWVSESKTPADLRHVAELQLDFCARQIDRDQFPRIPLNEKLIADARNKLKDFPAPYRYLSRKVTEISKQIDDTIGPTTVDGLLTRASSDASLLTGKYTVPGAYTRSGYDLMKEAIQNADEEMKKDDWVMGDAGKNDIPRASETAQIEDKYLRDYAMHWTAFVRDTDVKAYRNRETAITAIQTFSQPNSPMRILAREIAKNTNLSEEPETDDWWPWIKSFFVKKKAAGGGNTEPEKAFRPLFDFVGKKDQKSQFDTYASEMNKLYVALNTKTNSDNDLKRLGQELTLDDKDTLDVKKRETTVASLVAPFSSTPSGQELAGLLQEPLAKLRTYMGAGGKELLTKTWAEQILPAAKEIEKGYPFDESGSEADLKLLTAFLAPGEGTLSKFYDEKLKNYIELANGQYRVKDGSEFQFSEEFVAYLNNAFALREALFGKSATPKFEYEFTLRPSKDLIEVTIDGQKTTSEGTGSLKGTFPGANSSETGVIIKLASTSETTPASSSNSNVSTTSNSPSGGSSGPRTFQGQWGLFKFVDAGSPEKQAGGEYALKYTVGGKPVSAMIKASGGDLFNKNMFRQVRAPQNFLK